MEQERDIYGASRLSLGSQGRKGWHDPGGGALADE